MKKGTCLQQGSTKNGQSPPFHRLTLAASLDCFKGFLLFYYLKWYLSSKNK